LPPREAHATASGCRLWSANDGPGWEGTEPDCAGSGSGCYLCAYHNTGDDGFTICSLNPDGSGPCGGKACCDAVIEIPPDWPAPDPDVTDPDPGAPPPNAPPPDSPPGDDTGDPGGPGDGICDGSPSHDCSDSIVIREMSELMPQVTALLGKTRSANPAATLHDPATASPAAAACRR